MLPPRTCSVLNFNITSEAAASSFVTLPDSWITLYDAVSDVNNPFTNTATSITLPASLGRESCGCDRRIIGSGGYVRIVLFNQNSRMSEVRYLTSTSQISGNTISWPTTPAEQRAVLQRHERQRPGVANSD